ncbi:MAG: hypothetical protein ACN6I3_00405 [bacterium]
MRSKACFPYDLVACYAWCKEHGYTPILEGPPIQTVIIDSVRRVGLWPKDPEILGILDSIPLLSLNECLKRAWNDPRVLWIFLGSSVIAGTYLKPKVQEALKGHKFIAIAGASVFNGGYTGIRIHPWNAVRTGPGKSLNLGFFQCENGW